MVKYFCKNKDNGLNVFCYSFYAMKSEFVADFVVFFHILHALLLFGLLLVGIKVMLTQNKMSCNYWDIVV